MSRAVAATLSPRSRAAMAHSRPKPRDVPVMNQTLAAMRLPPVRMTTFMRSSDERHQVRCGLLAPARVGGASARVLLEPVNAVIAEDAAKPIAGVMSVQLLRSDLVDVELAEVATLDEALHRLRLIGEQVR